MDTVTPVPDDTTSLVARVDAWLDTFEGPTCGPEDLRAWVTDDAVFVERPNLVSPRGGHHDVVAMQAGIEAGRRHVARQAYRDRHHVVTGPASVATRARWQGELAVDVGPWPAGTVLTAEIAMFVEFADDGRLRRQENFDCYYPVETGGEVAAEEDAA